MNEGGPVRVCEGAGPRPGHLLSLLECKGGEVALKEKSHRHAMCAQGQGEARQCVHSVWYQVISTEDK